MTPEEQAREILDTSGIAGDISFLPAVTVRLLIAAIAASLRNAQEERICSKCGARIEHQPDAICKALHDALAALEKAEKGDR